MLHGMQNIDWLRLIVVACVVATPQVWTVAEAAEPPPPNIVWLTATGDLGFVLPETTLVKNHIWPPDGQGPCRLGSVDRHRLTARG